MTLYPNEEEDEITRLRRDEMEVNLAQRMAMLGYKPELLEEGDRDIRFVYRKQEQQEQQQAQQQQAMMPPGGGMPPQMMPPSQPGGEGMGIRTPRSPARPQARSSPGAGSPMTSVQQRGPAPTISQQNSNAMLNSRMPRGQ